MDTHTSLYVIMTGEIPGELPAEGEYIVPCPVDPGWDPAGPEKIDEIQEKGVQALLFSRPSYHLDNEIYYPLFDRAEELEIPVVIESGIFPVREGDAANGVSADKTDILRIDALARCFPELHILVVHHEYPGAADALMFAECRENVWFSLQADYSAEVLLRQISAPVYNEIFCRNGILSASPDCLGAWPGRVRESLAGAGADAAVIGQLESGNCRKYLFSGS